MGRRRSKRVAKMTMPEEQDDVDAFHAGRDTVALAGGDAQQAEDEGGDEAVMDLNAFQDSSDDSDDGSDDSDDSNDGSDAGKPAVPAAAGTGNSDDDSDSGEEEQEETRGTAGWGKKRRDFYGGDTGDLSDLDEDDARDEEAEAKRLQRERAELLQDDDFDMGMPLEESSKPAKKGKKGKKLSKAERRKEKQQRKDAQALADANASVSSAASRLLSDVAVERVTKDVSGMSEEDKLQMVISDSPELLGLLEEFKNYVIEIKDQIRPVLERLEASDLPTTRGVSFLQVKLHLLLSYVTYLAFYLLLKAEGRNVKDHPVLDAILKTRTMLDRIKPLDAKLQYQIEKLLRSGREVLDQSKPNPHNLVAHGADGDDVDMEVGEGGDDAGAYQALKRMAVPYETKSSKELKREERRKKRLRRSKTLAELKEEFSEAPEELRERIRTTGSKHLDDMDKARTAFEEEHMTRLVVSKKEKKLRRQKERQAQRWDTLADLEDFGDLGDLMADEEAAGAGTELKGSASRRRALKAAVNQAEQRHRSAVERSSLISGDQTVATRKRKAKQSLEDVAEVDKHFGGGPVGSYFEPDPPSDDETYKAAQSAKEQRRAAKRARREAVTEDKRARAAASVLPEEDVGEGFSKRKINRAISKNKGLTKYRKKEEANPRKHLRKKYEKKLKARSGQVRKMREPEAHNYGGETSGIRSSVSRSYKLSK